MNQEINLKLKQAAETAWEQDQQTNPTPVNPYAYVYGYKAGAQTILENPSEWGLVGAQWKEDAIHNADTGVEIAAERDRYRDALERIMEESWSFERPHKITKETLKEDGFDPTTETL